MNRIPYYLSLGGIVLGEVVMYSVAGWLGQILGGAMMLAGVVGMMRTTGPSLDYIKSGLQPAPILVDQLHEWVGSRRALRGLIILDKVQFYVTMTRIFMAIPLAMAEAQPRATANPRASGLLSVVEANRLMEIVGKAKTHLFGQALVNKQACLQQIERLRAALQHDLEQVPSSGSAAE